MQLIKQLQNELDNLDERLDYLVSNNKINESTEKSWNCIIRGKRKRLFNLIKKKERKYETITKL